MDAIRIHPSLDLVETGDWGKDNQRGRELALRTIDHMMTNDMPGYLGLVVKDMIRAGRYGGIEVGFCHVLAVMIME